MAASRSRSAASSRLQLACHLSKALQEGDHNNVRHFRSRSDYLASFLADLASGSAWSQWYYESFSGLKPLPVPAALRTAICNDVATGKLALSLLPPVELQQVLHQLSSQDARRILERFAEEETAFEEALCREAVAGAMSGNLVGLTRLADEWRRALYLFIVAARETTQAGGAPLRDAAVAAAKLADRLSGASVAESEKLIAAYARKAAPFRSSADAAAQMGADWRTTAFGEIFLLLPCLDEMPLSEATRDWPATDGLAAVSLARWLVLLKCCGRGQSARAFYDPLLRDLLSIPLTVSPETLRALAGAAYAETSGRFSSCGDRMAILAWRNRGQRTAGCERHATGHATGAGFDRCRARALVAR